jgi:hypothetical protein
MFVQQQACDEESGEHEEQGHPDCAPAALCVPVVEDDKEHRDPAQPVERKQPPCPVPRHERKGACSRRARALMRADLSERPTPRSGVTDRASWLDERPRSVNGLNAAQGSSERGSRRFGVIVLRSLEKTSRQ